MKYLGIEEEDMDLLVYGVPQYLIDYIKLLRKTYPDVKVVVPAYEKAMKIKRQIYAQSYSVRYFVDNLPVGFDLDEEYYKYLKSLGKNII